MNLHFTLPTATQMADFESLEDALAKDLNGQKAHGLLRYFENVEVEMRSLRMRSQDFAERDLAGQLAEAFSVSRRIVTAAWEKLQDRELRV